MYNAPSVTFPVGRCHFYAWLLAALGLLGMAVLVNGVLGIEQPGAWSGWVGAVAWASWLAFAAWSWWYSPLGHLRWDAAMLEQADSRQGVWLWRAASSPEAAPLQRVEMMVDLQSHVLLCLHSADKLARWVWVERTRDPLRWHDLRRALVAHT